METVRLVDESASSHRWPAGALTFKLGVVGIALAIAGAAFPHGGSVEGVAGYEIVMEVGLSAVEVATDQTAQ